MMDFYNFFLKNGLIIELLIAMAMFTHWMVQRTGIVIRVLICAASLICASLLWNLIPMQNAWFRSLRYMLLFAVCIVGILFCFKVKVNCALFYGTAAAVVQHFVFKAASYGILLTEQIYGQNVWSEFILYPLYSCILFVLCYFIFAIPLNRTRSNGLKGGAVMGLLIGMLICVNLFQNLFEEYSVGIVDHLYTVMVLFDLVSCLFLLALQGQIANREKSEQSNIILNHMLHQQKEQMQTSKDTIDLINVKCHDIKKQIAMLGNRVSEAELNELNRTIGIYDAIARTGNEALDILLAEKSLMCEKRNIHFTYIVDGACLNFLKPTDTYALFGNALDNAIEAAAKLPDIEQRYIGMRVCIEKGMAMIHIENRYQDKPRFHDGLPETSKPDKRYHGFGTKSMWMITEKYHGSITMKAGEEMFTVNILLPGR